MFNKQILQELTEYVGYDLQMFWEGCEFEAAHLIFDTLSVNLPQPVYLPLLLLCAFDSALTEVWNVLRCYIIGQHDYEEVYASGESGKFELNCRRCDFGIGGFMCP